MQQIGRYRILGELGRGAMGVVYRALDPSIGRPVAIKTIRISDLPSEAERTKLHERLFREAQSAGVLSHPNIVTIYDVSEQGDLAYIAMELVEGPTLEKWVQTETPEGDVILDILRQTASALDYAHKRGVIHRDIKPANIMLHESSTVKITDFGIAKLQSHQATQTTTITGTPNYMSPEQIQGQSVDGRADQFSLGVIAYELLTGEKPFSGESMPTLLFKIVREEPMAPQRLNPSLGWPVETVLKRALGKNPADRYESCTDFIRALENACHSSKGWKPLAAGASQDMPTMMEPAPSPPPAPVPLVVAPAPSAVPSARVEPAAPPPSLEAPPPQRVPKPLRIARALAMIIVAGGLVSVLMIAGLNYFGDRETQAPPGTVDETKPADAPAAAQTTPAASTPPAVDRPAAEPEKKAAEDIPNPPPPRSKPSPMPTPSAQDVAARLVTNPPGATLTIDRDSALSCTTPCSLNLPPGRHTLSAAMAGHRTSLKIFELPRDSEVFMNMEKTTGTIMIRSDPPGASISIDGQQRSEKTPAMLTLPTGQHRIEVAKEGFKTYVESLETKDTVITNIDVNWGKTQ